MKLDLDETKPRISILFSTDWVSKMKSSLTQFRQLAADADELFWGGTWP